MQRDATEPIARYPYHAANGSLLCELRRFYPKRFELRDDMGELIPEFPAAVSLYRLPELGRADRGETVYVVEGEKDVDNLRERGLVATTNAGGTRRGWRPEYGEHLRGRHVVILPDADGPGQRHAAAVAGMLKGVARSCIVLNLPRLHGPDDVTDWLNRGNSIGKLLELTAKARLQAAGLERAPKGPEKAALIFAADLEPLAKLVLLAMWHQCRHDSARRLDLAELSAAELARLTGSHRVTVQKIITRLRTEGVLRRDGIGHVLVWDILAAIGTPA